MKGCVNKETSKCYKNKISKKKKKKKKKIAVPIHNLSTPGSQCFLRKMFLTHKRKQEMPICDL